MLLSLVLVFSTLPAVATNDPAAACARVDASYRACGPRYQYDGRDFLFAYDRARETVACTDGEDLTYFDRLDHMDIASVLMFPYSPGATSLPEKRQNWDPGRLRSEALFKTIFGADETEVRANLVPVPFLGQTVNFQRRLGAAAALKAAGEELALEAARDPSLAKFLAPFTDRKQDLRYYGFYWRVVKGTSRLSAHSFGTAIDLLTDAPYQYWLWDEEKIHPDKAARGENAYRDDHYLPPGAPSFHPKAVAIFEKHGFVWGGKWNHYDTMHFEYRPEFFPGLAINCGPGEEPASIIQDAAYEEDFAPIEVDH